jgi:acetyl esterase/lipase
MLNNGELTAEQISTLTASVDIDAPPPGTRPSALVLFGTNQTPPSRIAADRYHRGLAPLIIATGGINRHDGIVEGREFARQLAAADVPASAVRIEDQSKDTWQNVELSLHHLREALAKGLPLVAVSKWYHLRAVYCVRTQLPEAVPLYAIGWEPVYAGTLVTRDNWPSSPDGLRRVIRESQEVPRRVAEGSYLPAVKKDGSWL